MTGTCTALVGAVRNAVDGLAPEAARLAAAQLVHCVGRLNGGVSDAQALELLKALLRKRWFDIADPLADAFAAIPSASSELRRRCAQVMLERGRHGPALRILLDLRGKPDVDAAEVLGHIARIRKQEYVESIEQGAPDARLLERATRAYLDAYEEDPDARTWHGINAVALLRCCEGESGLDALRRRKDASTLARAILDRVSGMPQRQTWDLGTAAEAALALGEYDQAAAWLRQYIGDAGADAFELGATLRQLEQIWRLGERSDPSARALLDLLRAALLEKTNATVPVTAADIQRVRTTAPQLEAVFGIDRFDSLENYRRGLERCACVARIGRSTETGAGTGFVLPGRLLGLEPPEAFVLVTNAHVLSDRDAERNRGSLHPVEAVVTFAALPGVSPEQAFEIGDILFSSDREALDVTVARLRPDIPAVAAYPVAQVLPARESKAQVRVIGHPSGRGLSFSVNELLDHESPRVHYRTATEGGSSGSPVFNPEWKLIALHHAGGQSVPRLNGQDGSYQANEGIWIGAIREGIRRHLDTPRSG